MHNSLFAHKIIKDSFHLWILNEKNKWFNLLNRGYDHVSDPLMQIFQYITIFFEKTKQKTQQVTHLFLFATFNKITVGFSFYLHCVAPLVNFLNAFHSNVYRQYIFENMRQLERLIMPSIKSTCLVFRC